MVGIDKLLSLICDFTSERSREGTMNKEVLLTDNGLHICFILAYVIVFQDGYGAESQAIKDIIYDVNFQIAKEEGGYLAEQNIPNRDNGLHICFILAYVIVFQDGYGADSQAIKDIIYDVNFQIAKEEGGYLAEQNIPNRRIRRNRIALGELYTEMRVMPWSSRKTSRQSKWKTQLWMTSSKTQSTNSTEDRMALVVKHVRVVPDLIPMTELYWACFDLIATNDVVQGLFLALPDDEKLPFLKRQTKESRNDFFDN
ncbi:hypothetical protein AALP_AA5G257900 [Arabis alpina]|uniref:Uncharacterized protein n=1 Tax=Arabis alpina TaxID=50452 RepID=A0A087GZD4_ARAAL|nr:hypothetical protein AALP_AA5G257900 [Arabis alpina]